MARSNAMVFYRCVKAPHGHPFAGLYGVEKLIIKAGAIVSKELVHEWDLRIISESILAKLGGAAAYEAYAYDNGEPEDLTGKPESVVVEARKPEDLKDLTQRKLNKELRMKE
jgi:hypothetical protein